MLKIFVKIVPTTDKMIVLAGAKLEHYQTNELLSLQEALNNVSPFDNSAMDAYAIRFSD